MENKKFEIATIMTIEVAENLYKKGTCIIVTDGKFIEVEGDLK